MANGLWVGSVNDSVSRQSVNQARITVTDPDTGNLLGLYSDIEGTKPIGNPFLTREDGLVKFYVRAGRINISAFRNGVEKIFENEIVLEFLGSCSCGAVKAYWANIASWDAERPEIEFSLGPQEHLFVAMGFNEAGFTEIEWSASELTINVFHEVGDLIVYDIFAPYMSSIGDRATFTLSATIDGDTENAPRYAAAAIVGNLTPIDACRVITLDSANGPDGLPLIAAPTDCETAIGLCAIFSVESFGAPTQTGFPNIHGGNFFLDFSQDYDDASQNIARSGIGFNIAGVIAGLRTAATPAYPPVTIAVTSEADEQITISIGYAGDRSLLFNLVPQRRVVGDSAWISSSPIASEATSYIYNSSEVSVGDEYELRVLTGYLEHTLDSDYSRVPSGVVVGSPETAGGGGDWQYDITVGLNGSGEFRGFGTIYHWAGDPDFENINSPTGTIDNTSIELTTGTATIVGVAIFTNSYFIIQILGEHTQDEFYSISPSGVGSTLLAMDSPFFTYDAVNGITQWAWEIPDYDNSWIAGEQSGFDYAIEQNLAVVWDPATAGPEIGLTDNTYPDQIAQTLAELTGVNNVKATSGHGDEGKWFFRIDILALPVMSPEDGYNLVIGVIELSDSMELTLGSFGTSGIGYRTDGYIYKGGVATDSGVPYSVGSTIDVAVDLDNSKIWFAVNTLWVNGDPETATGGTTIGAGDSWIPAVTFLEHAASVSIITLTDDIGDPSEIPAGFTPWAESG